jgi:hypothetical protein
MTRYAISTDFGYLMDARGVQYVDHPEEGAKLFDFMTVGILHAIKVLEPEGIPYAIVPVHITPSED